MASVDNYTIFEPELRQAHSVNPSNRRASMSLFLQWLSYAFRGSRLGPRPLLGNAHRDARLTLFLRPAPPYS